MHGGIAVKSDRFECRVCERLTEMEPPDRSMPETPQSMTGVAIGYLERRSAIVTKLRNAGFLEAARESYLRVAASYERMAIDMKNLASLNSARSRRGIGPPRHGLVPKL